MGDIQQFILNKLEKLDEKLDTLRDFSADTRLAVESRNAANKEMSSEVKRLAEVVKDQGGKLDEYNKQLEIHISTNMMLKARQDEMDKKIDPMWNVFHSDEIVEKWYNEKWAKRAKWAGYITAIVGATVALHELYLKF